MNRKALGLLETYGYIGAIEAADACLKAANVELIGLELVRGGLVTIKICGDVSAVKASIDAGAVAADRVGKVVSIDVIARMGEGLDKIICKQDVEEEINIVIQAETTEAVQEHIEDSVKKEDLDIKDKIINNEALTKEIINHNGKSIKISDEKALIDLKVVDLRRIARSVDGISIEKSMIKFAKKRELIEALTSYFNREVE